MPSLKTMLKNRMDRERVYSQPDFWNEKAREYDGDAISMWANNHLNALYHAEQVRTLAEFVRASFDRELDLAADCENPTAALADLDVLDAGCGTGRMTRLFAANGARTRGFDFAAEAVEVARTLSPTGRPEYFVESILELDEEAGCDLALTWGALTVACRNAGQLGVAFRNLHRALRPGGRLFMMEPVHRGFLHRVLNLTVREFVAVLEGAGFEVETRRQLHFWPARLGLAYVQWPKFLTVPGYHVGQAMMRYLTFGRMGDYQAIVARRAG